MAERLHQLGFDDQFRITTPKDVTPDDFIGLTSPIPKRELNPVVSELGRFVREAKETIQIGSPADAAQYLLKHIYASFQQFDQEETWVLLLNMKHQVTHEVMVYRGTVNSVLIRPAEVLKEAVRVNAPVIILSHNHPSGDATPSPEDYQVTEAISQAANLLGVQVLDHLVIGMNRWTSLKERGTGLGSSNASSCYSSLYTAE